MDIRWFSGKWWVYMWGRPYRHATATDITRWIESIWKATDKTTKI